MQLLKSSLQVYITILDFNSMEGLEVYTWISATKPYHITYGDIIGWEYKDVYSNEQQKIVKDVLVLDRNFEEYGMWKNIPKDTKLKPEELFKYNRAKLTHTIGYEWEVEWEGGPKATCKPSVCTKALATTWSWVELNEANRVVIESEMIEECMELPRKDPIVIPLSNFPHQTRVGYRGPMMLWEDLKKLPDVRW